MSTLRKFGYTVRKVSYDTESDVDAKNRLRQDTSDEAKVAPTTLPSPSTTKPAQPTLSKAQSSATPSKSQQHKWQLASTAKSKKDVKKDNHSITEYLVPKSHTSTGRQTSVDLDLEEPESPIICRIRYSLPFEDVWNMLLEEFSDDSVLNIDDDVTVNPLPSQRESEPSRRRKHLDDNESCERRVRVRPSQPSYSIENYCERSPTMALLLELENEPLEERVLCRIRNPMTPEQSANYIDFIASELLLY